MEEKSYLSKGIKKTRLLTSDILFLCETRLKETYFTRMGSNKMTFKSIIFFILNFVKKSLQLELDDFFNSVNKSDFTVTKQAFSEARQKILPIAFVMMADVVVKWFYEDTDFKKYKGYRLIGIDGTILEINNSEKLRNEFGYIENQTIKVARARGECLYDIENDMILTSVIGKYKASERTQAEGLINKLDKIGFSNDLMIFDRGYPSRAFISFLESKKISYLMRVSTAFLNVVVNVKNEDQIIQTKYKGKIIKMRVIKLQLDSGVTEILITNIFDESFTVADFKILFFKRWGIEVKYNELKNKMQIENFTGETPISIKQDFYATMYLENMVSLAKMDANVIIQRENKDKNLKYECKVNTNILIGKLKNSLVYMLLEDSSRKRSRILDKIMKEISRNIIPIRPGRSFIRRMTVRANKKPLNKKRSL